MIDTLRISKRLVAAGAEPALADALAEELAAASAGPDLSQLATRAELKNELAEVEHRLRIGLADLRTEIVQTSNRLLMWLIPLLLAQVGGLLFLVLRQGGAP
jgi:hypothetical protein